MLTYVRPHLILAAICEGGVTIIPIFEKWHLRLKEIQLLAQEYTALKR